MRYKEITFTKNWLAMVFTGSILISAYLQSDFFGKIIFLALFALSIFCWIILLYKVRQIKSVKKLSIAFDNALKSSERLFAIDPNDLPKPASQNALHPFGDVYFSLKQKTLEILQKNHYFAADGEKAVAHLTLSDIELIETHVLTTVSKQAKRIDKELFILSTITTLAPFLGLLGTVWGILLTFAGMQTSGSAGSNASVLSGLSTALATTVLGLVIAIPALIAYNYLKNSSKHYSSDMEDFLYRLLSSIELQYRKPL